jgi:hypothetical protein
MYGAVLGVCFACMLLYFLWYCTVPICTLHLTRILDTSLGRIDKKELVEPPSPSTPSPMDPHPVVPPRIIQGTPGGYGRGVASSIFIPLSGLTYLTDTPMWHTHHYSIFVVYIITNSLVCILCTHADWWYQPWSNWCVSGRKCWNGHSATWPWRRCELPRWGKTYKNLSSTCASLTADIIHTDWSYTTVWPISSLACKLCW